MIRLIELTRARRLGTSDYYPSQEGKAPTAGDARRSWAAAVAMRRTVDLVAAVLLLLAAALHPSAPTDQTIL